MGDHATMFGILAILLPVAVWGIAREVRRQRSAGAALAQARALGLDEPVSLHPHIDPERCLGCGACVTACPEGDILGLVNGRAQLIAASRCVGHGACRSACPNDAIDLVFGTAKRGVQIPDVGPNYESNVPGLYIAGELGGMGLIRNAVRQGVQAVGHLARTLECDRTGDFDVDVAVVGAGPAGLAAALACRERGLSHVVFDQDGLGGSIAHYPRRKLVLTSPVDLPLVGAMRFHEVDKEALLRFWTAVVRDAGIELRAPQRVRDVQRTGDGFLVVTDGGAVRARRVVLAVGRRGTPRKLGVPGEDSEKVAFRLLEPERWAGSRVLVVGGGNSAVEAAVSLAEEGAHVTLSYRGTAFSRIAPANQKRLESRHARGLGVLLESTVQEIGVDRVRLETPPGQRDIANDQVFVLIGGEAPSEFLDKIGVRMSWHHGERSNRMAGAR